MVQQFDVCEVARNAHGEHDMRVSARCVGGARRSERDVRPRPFVLRKIVFEHALLGDDAVADLLLIGGRYRVVVCVDGGISTRRARNRVDLVFKPGVEYTVSVCASTVPSEPVQTIFKFTSYDSLPRLATRS